MKLVIVESDVKVNWADSIIIQDEAVGAKYMKYIWLQAHKRVSIIAEKIVRAATTITLEHNIIVRNG